MALVRRNPGVRLFVYTLEFSQLTAIPAIFQHHGITLTEAVQLGVSRLGAKGEMDREPAPWLISGQVR